MKLIRIGVLLFVFALISKLSSAQFLLKIKSNNTLDSIAYLRGMAFDDKNFIPKDTLELYKGVNIVKNSKPIVGGIYYLYFPKSKQKIFLSIENKDTIHITISDSNYLKTITTKSFTNDSFFAYQRLEQKLATYDSLYDTQIKQGRKFNAMQKALFFKPKYTQLSNARNSIMKMLKPANALYVYFDVLNKLDLSIPNKKNYTGRSVFINSIDINSPKLLFNPCLKQVYIEYLSYYPMQADSIIKGIDTIMQKLDCKGKAYAYSFDYIIKLLKNRDIQNNPSAYSYFIKKYVKDSKCKFLDPKLEKQLLEEYTKVEALKLQDTSLNMILKDTAGNDQSLHAFAEKFDYTLITFFDPTCEHCKVELPKMDSAINLLEKQLVLTIGKFTVCNDMIAQPAVWNNFINEHHLVHNYMHVHLNNNNEIRKAYDAYTNPLFYLIDSHGKLIGKKLSVNTLKKVITSYIQNGK
jgi:hypothetical protein